MALTITASEVDGWDTILQNVAEASSTIDLHLSYASTIHLDIALAAAVAHTGTRILVQTIGDAATGDHENWSTFMSFIACVGTGAIEATLDDPLAALSTTIDVASLTGFTVATGGTLLALIEDGTLADSELVRIISTEVDGGAGSNDLITLLDATTTPHAAPSVLHNVVEQFVIPIPFGTTAARIVWDNTYDADGDAIFVRTRVVKTTALT